MAQAMSGSLTDPDYLAARALSVRARRTARARQAYSTTTTRRARFAGVLGRVFGRGSGWLRQHLRPGRRRRGWASRVRVDVGPVPRRAAADRAGLRPRAGPWPTQATEVLGHSARSVRRRGAVRCAGAGSGRSVAATRGGPVNSADAPSDLTASGTEAAPGAATRQRPSAPGPVGRRRSTASGCAASSARA